MTENSEELAELQRAHSALESRVATILPALATKADLEAMGRHLTEHFDQRLDQRFDAMNQRLDSLQKTMTDGFNRIWLWIAGTLVAVIVAILGSSWFAPVRQAPPAPPAAPVVYHLYPPGYTAVPAAQVAPPPQP